MAEQKVERRAAEGLSTQMVTLGSAAAIIMVVFGVAWNQASWQRGIEKDLEFLVGRLSVLDSLMDERTADRWRCADMVRLQREFKARNPTMHVPLPVCDR